MGTKSSQRGWFPRFRTDSRSRFPQTSHALSSVTISFLCIRNRSKAKVYFPPTYPFSSRWGLNRYCSPITRLSLGKELKDPSLSLLEPFRAHRPRSFSTNPRATFALLDPTCFFHPLREPPSHSRPLNAMGHPVQHVRLLSSGIDRRRPLLPKLA